MKKLILLIPVILLAADQPKPKVDDGKLTEAQTCHLQLSDAEKTINQMAAHIADLEKQLTQAIQQLNQGNDAKIHDQICKEHGFDLCDVDSQKGTVTKKEDKKEGK